MRIILCGSDFELFRRIFFLEVVVLFDISFELGLFERLVCSRPAKDHGVK